ncbi:hypothetical protein [Desulfosediminicola flagellatus]|uniref:hypothetical protein n=1 Tax=Desulfosediminicola flagellatus TaxID=2569541 RepID=UPI0010AD97E2|nr:hypothetical protein [Desulfosediminicola flagellatus]
MKIHLTKKEYRNLLDILSISDWVMNAHRNEVEAKCKPYNELQQKILSYARDFGCDDVVESDKNSNTYYLTHMDDDEAISNEFIKEYEEEFFWDELTSRLSQRDLIEEKGYDAVVEMKPIERMTKTEEFSDKYHDEFENNGIKNLIIKK